MGAVPPTAPQNGPSRGRVLVVDDDAALAEMLGIVLRREGYEPAFVSDGNRAVGVFQQTRPDLVLLDLMLPGRNGLQICQDIRTQSTVPIVMLTAKGDTIDVVQGLEAGADDYVTKPFKPVELVARVRAQLRRGETGQAENLAIGDVQIDVPAHQVTRDGVADRADPAGVRPAGRAGPQAAPGVHPRAAARAGVGLPARGRHPAGQRPRAAAARQDRARPGEARGRADRARRRLQGGPP